MKIITERPLFIIVGRLEKIGRPEFFGEGGGGFKNEISPKQPKSYNYS